jgi:hypothetical protein
VSCEILVIPAEVDTVFVMTVLQVIDPPVLLNRTELIPIELICVPTKEVDTKTEFNARESDDSTRPPISSTAVETLFVETVFRTALPPTVSCPCVCNKVVNCRVDVANACVDAV